MQTILLICFIVFLFLLILLEKIKSIKIIIRLFLSLGLIYWYIKFISDGRSILKFSLLITVLLTVINIFIEDGFNRKSFSELISILITSFLTSFVVFIICKKVNPEIYKDVIMSLNGVKNSENALTGIYMIFSLGIFMDAISRMIFSIDDQKDKAIDVPWKEQFSRGIEISKSCIIEKINMIVLIFCGITLFLICLNINKGMNILEVFNKPDIFSYSLVMIILCIGIILSVYISAFVYACLNRKKTIYKITSENKLDGKRSLKL